jgi:hypothetical protein
MLVVRGLSMNTLALRLLSLLAVVVTVMGGIARGQEAARPVGESERHWSFRKVVQPAVPSVRNHGLVRSPVDAFVLAKLEERGLTFSPVADRTALIRRVSFDLIGLPPSPAEVTAFVTNDNPTAYDDLLDRLLASQHFGERWGRHWLDAAGYADVMSTDNDAGIIHPLENRWLYRDYVVRSLNADKPFARFLTEQIAGDELVEWRTAATYSPEIREHLIATGFLRASSDDTFAPELNKPLTQYGVLQRTGEILANNVLGLTLNCAKCHDHKYEPLTQRDYYAFLALLQPAFNPDRWLIPVQRQLPNVSAAEKTEIERGNAELDRQAGELRKQIAERRAIYEAKLLATKLAALPEAIRADTQTALATPADKQTEVQKYLADKFGMTLAVKPEEVTSVLSDADIAATAEWEKQAAETLSRKKSWQHWQVTYDGPVTPTKLLKRGNHETPGEEVSPGFLAVLSHATALDDGKSTGTTSGRRLALARWLTDRESPAAHLAMRVQVNRVWQHLFGKGLAETTDNLGVTGAKPTLPELLEWLAAEYFDNGGRLKLLLKRIMTSRVYLQTSSVTPNQTAASQVDPDNRLLWRMRLRRLESEIVRDAVLAVSGKLDATLGGAPILVEPRPDGTFVIPDKGLPTPTSQWRRTLYLLARRNYHPTILSVFDQPNLTTNCTGRESSAVVLQSLTMLNDRFLLEQAEHLAARVSGTAGSNTSEQIELAFRITLGRLPRDSEQMACVEFFRRQFQHYSEEKLPADQAALKALSQVCHTLLNASEFLYVP